MMLQKQSVYEQTVEITNDYLGPASRRFIDRQVISHLNKKPEKITTRDLSKLKVWIEAVASLLTDDKQTVSDYIRRLEKLSKKR